MSSERRLTRGTLRRRYRDAARFGDWDACRLIVTQLLACRFDGPELAEVIYADGYAREHAGDLDNARRCYELAVEKGHVKAAQRLAALGGPVPKLPPRRAY